MKAPFFFTLIAVLLTSCVQNDDFTLPNTTVQNPTINGDIVSINAIAGVLAQANANGNTTHTFENTNQYISGYVISTDEAGNFFEEILIQDALENPTIGIKIIIDSNPLFTKYELGRRLFIKLDGLTIGTTNGVFTIGVAQGTTVGQIPATFETRFIKRSSEIGVLIPKIINLDQLNDGLTNLYVGLENAQFANSDISKTYASETTDQFDGERTLESCDSNLSIVFSTSTFSDFKSLTLPSQQGTIKGVLTKNFFGDVFNFVVNSPADVNFNDSGRCDVKIIDCGLKNNQGANIIFTENFQTQSTNQLISGNGWTNFIQEGTEGFEAFSSNGANASLGISARVSSRNSGDLRSIAWLISPQINLETQNNETFHFMSSNSFADGSHLDVLISTNWDGNEATIAAATWRPLTSAFVVGDNDFFGDWFPSGNIDLSCISGLIHIAFRYTGNGDSSFDGTYELDEITIDYE